MSADNANRVAKDINGVPMVGDLTKEADLDRVFGERDVEDRPGGRSS